VYGSMARVEKTCEVCVEFNGARRCARAAGATDQEATSAAQTTFPRRFRLFPMTRLPRRLTSIRSIANPRTRSKFILRKLV